MSKFNVGDTLYQLDETGQVHTCKLQTINQTEFGARYVLIGRYRHYYSDCEMSSFFHTVDDAFEHFQKYAAYEIESYKSKAEHNKQRANDWENALRTAKRLVREWHLNHGEWIKLVKICDKVGPSYLAIPSNSPPLKRVLVYVSDDVSVRFPDGTIADVRIVRNGMDQGFMWQFNGLEQFVSLTDVEVRKCWATGEVR